MEIKLIKKNERLGITNTYLIIYPRRECSNYFQCKYGRDCKFNRFKSKFHKHIVVQGKSSDLSGTELCPFHMPRLYTCWDCIYCNGDVDGPCLNPNRKNEMTYNDPDWGAHHRCTGFTPDTWCNDWSRKTGERIYKSE